MTSNEHRINGLILTGGKSSRLGYRKEIIKWHGIPQWEYLARKLGPLVTEMFLSDTSVWQNTIPTIVDKFPDKGPIGGILSALESDSSASWLVIACDIPLISNDSLFKIVNSYRKNPELTCFFNLKKNQPEPLFSIWPANMRIPLKQATQKGDNSLQPHLTTANFIDISSDEAINVNTLPDYFKVKSKLPYLPIDCNYYDRLEAAALQPSATIEYFDGNDLVVIEEKILTTEVKDHSEYLVTSTGKRIRMDMIHQINSIPNPIQ